MHQFAAVDIDLGEHLFEQQRTRDQRQLPLRGLTLQLQFEIALQTAAVTLEHGEEQTVLLGPGALVRQGLPAIGVAAGNALWADAVILLQRGFQQPEQAVVLGQHKGAFADQRLRQCTQVFFLDETAVDHRRFGQLIAQLLQIESVSAEAQQQPGQGGSELAREKTQGAAQCQAGRVIVDVHRGQAPSHRGSHFKALSTASVKTLGEASCISRVAISTATCTVLARVKRSPLARSVIR